MTKETKLKLSDFLNWTLKSGLEYGDFYCGITDDVPRRLKEHYCVLQPYRSVKCSSADEARELEKCLGEYGFDVGARAANGGNKNSLFFLRMRLSQYTLLHTHV